MMGKTSLLLLASFAAASAGIIAMKSDFQQGAQNSMTENESLGSFNLNALNSQQLPQNIVLPKGVVGAVFNSMKTQSGGHP